MQKGLQLLALFLSTMAIVYAHGVPAAHDPQPAGVCRAWEGGFETGNLPFFCAVDHWVTGEEGSCDPDIPCHFEGGGTVTCLSFSGGASWEHDLPCGVVGPTIQLSVAGTPVVQWDITCGECPVEIAP